MNTWTQALVPSTALIREAVKAIDSSKIQIALIVDDAGCLRGTVTDGDVRRALLGGVGLDQPVTGIMNADPVTAGPDESPQQLLTRMRKTTLRCIPVVDDAR